MIALLALLAVAPSRTLAVTDLRTDARPRPLEVGTASPELSWRLTTIGSARNLRQSGYRIVAATDPGLTVPGKADLWDSGLVRSGATFGVVYGGPAPKPGRPVYWRVQAIDQAGVPSAWSPVTHWARGLEPNDWSAARWIGSDAPRKALQSPSLFPGAMWIWAGSATESRFHRDVTVRPGLKSAELRITADDRFALLVNDRPIAQSPDVTDAWRTPVTVDLMPHLRPGVNRITVNGRNLGGAAGLLAYLRLRYAEGRDEVVVTDGNWTASTDGGGTKPVQTIGAYGVAPWNTIGEQPLLLPPALRFRREFEARRAVRRAVLYGTALGIVDFHLNGKRVSEDWFTPGWTDYVKRVYARAFDVTDRVRSGANVLAAELADGWYAGYVGYGGRRDHYGPSPRLRAILRIEYADGTSEEVRSDADWTATVSPTRVADFLMGEEYDARRERPDWSTPGGGGTWVPVDVGAPLDPVVQPFPGQPVRAFAVLRPKRITQPKPGVYVLDLGQNVAGHARIRLRGKSGQTLTLRFAERLNPDGGAYFTNLRGARATDRYVFRGGGVETWEPRFTFHGFQYIEVTGLDRAPKPDEIVGVAVSSDTPRVGDFESSSPMLNRLVENAWWTQRANFIDIPTDCPQRDERLGWTGDAQAYIRTASMLADVQPFFRKWLICLDDAQRADGQYPMVAPVKVAGDDGGPAWADAGVICPWTIYDVYGDRGLLARHYPNMKRFVEFCRKRSTPDLLPPAQFHAFGDWLNIDDPTPNEVIYTAYFSGSARLLAKAAKELGHEADVREYNALADAVAAAFRRAYVGANGRVRGDSQCGYVLALAFDLLTPEQTKLAASRLVQLIEARKGHLSTGFVGTRDIMHVLSKIGRNDVAFRLLHNDTFPSWGFTIKHGATSIWERWDGWTPERGFQDAGMNSFAHYAFGAVVGWMVAQPGGITNLEPGFGKVKIAPQIDPKLQWVRARYDSVRGTIRSEWKVEGNAVRLEVEVPPNVEAEVHVPGGAVERVGSGVHRFRGKVGTSR